MDNHHGGAAAPPPNPPVRRRLRHAIALVLGTALLAGTLGAAAVPAYADDSTVADTPAAPAPPVAPPAALQLPSDGIFKPAAAALTAYGRNTLVNYWTPDGDLGYCADVQADWPSGQTGAGYVVSSIGAVAGTRDVSGEALMKLHAGLDYAGWATDHDRAAAMAAFVYAYTSQNNHGHGGGLHYINTKAGSYAAAVTVQYNEIWNWVEANWNIGQPGNNTADTVIEVIDSQNFLFRATASPGNAVGTITVTGAVEASTGSSTFSVSSDAAVSLRGAPGDVEVKYDVAESGVWTAPGGYADQVRQYDTPGQQRLVAATGARRTNTFHSASRITDPVSTVFQPVVTSQMQQRLVGPGGTITDHATCDLAEDSQSPYWRTKLDGTGYVVPWKVAFYERFDGETGLPEVPEGRPVLATATDSCSGVGEVMEATVEQPAGITGDITAVWRIDMDAMSALTRGFIQGPWQDAFGLDEETVTAPLVRTKASEPVYDGEEYFDTAIHTHAELYPDTAVQVFSTYRMAKPGEQPVCDATTLVEEYAPVLIDGRTEVQSEKRIASPAMGDGYYFVEVTYPDDTLNYDERLSEGVCGDGSETIRRLVMPSAAELAATGFDGTPAGIIAVIAILGGAIATIGWRRKRARNAAATTEAP